MTGRHFLTIAVCILCFIGPAQAADTLREEIEARERDWVAAYNANDAESLAAIYDEDAILVMPGAEPVKGRAAIAEALKSFFPVLTKLDLIVDDVRPLGERHAVEVGHSTYQQVGEDGTLTPGSDNYVVVWHRGEDGVWRYMTDIFNER